MAEKSSGRAYASSTSPGNKPVPMKLFSTWEVERTAPNCIARLCSLRLTRLVVLKNLETDLGSVIIAVRMQSSKRTLRSNEIFFSQGSLVDTELDLSFSLQYPHFLKRDGNKLRVMLQRRKRYKNRTILGYKTLAVGLINMSEVLQQSKDNELSLYGKDHEMDRVAHVTVLGLSSQPVDQFKRGIDRSPDIDNESEDEEESYSSDQENSDSGENLPEAQVHDLLGEEEQEPGRKGIRTKLRPPMNRQRNFKQKFIALLKKFKVQSDDSDTEQYPYEDQDQNQIDPDFLLYDDLDDLNLSDSGPDMDQDEMSIGSTPKPVLRPFFSQGIPTSSTMAEEMEQFPLIDQCRDDNGNSKDSGSSGDFGVEDDTTPWSDNPPSLANRSESIISHQSDPGNLVLMKTTPSPNNERTVPLVNNSTNQKEKRHHSQSAPKTLTKEGSVCSQGSSTGQGSHTQAKSLEKASSFGKADHKHPGIPPLAEQLTDLWQGLADGQIPDRVILVSVLEKHGRLLAQTLSNTGEKVVCTCNHPDVEATLQFIVNKLQKYCNQNPKIPEPLKVALCGNESYAGAALRPYVELFSTKSTDWQNYIKFYVVPLGSNSLAKYLGSLDSRYSSLFLDSNWREFFDRDLPDNQPQMKSRRTRNVAYAKEMVNRICQYMTGSQHCLQLPIGEVMVTCKLRSTDEESIQKFIPFINHVRIGSVDGVSFSLSEGEDTSPGSTCGPLSSSPPGGPGSKEKDIAAASTPPSSPVVVNNSVSPLSGELMDLQVEYWPMLGGKKDKSSLKTAFRSLTVQRLPSHADPSTTGLSMVVVTKEKNKKIMRIGKKPREMETALKSQEIDGIHRLVCTSRTQDYSLKVTIDGIELTRVKFFQLSAQWQTRIKHFPVALFAQDLPAW
ncbi:phosphofurin acidic cluster sorting protein 1-like isoform X3 [Asterias rubens]|uniref:phosphofurin acidic cluster sorting protein 1-like isoform X3 n=1 Tax=Asterias rubens TaxID=7604 RepID=UPI00145534AF|nr:phosphofurin acidic cluster sorting protein 1-like isoform X3 [Asterias rubens]